MSTVEKRIVGATVGTPIKPQAVAEKALASWARQSKKPTYTASEVGAPTKSEFEQLSEKVEEIKTSGGGATEEQLEQIQKNKTAIDNIGKTMAGGTSGQFATSDGKGGIAWVTVANGNEVAY